MTSKWDFQAVRGILSLSAIGPSGSRTPAFSTRPSSRPWVLMKVEITSANAASFTLDTGDNQEVVRASGRYDGHIALVGLEGSFVSLLELN